MTLEQAKEKAKQYAKEQGKNFGVYNLNRFNPIYVVRELKDDKKDNQIVFEAWSNGVFFDRKGN